MGATWQTANGVNDNGWPKWATEKRSKSKRGQQEEETGRERHTETEIEG